MVLITINLDIYNSLGGISNICDILVLMNNSKLILELFIIEINLYHFNKFIIMQVTALTQEVEIRAILTTKQRNAIYGHLIRKATYKGSKQLKDTYFCRKEVQSFDELEMADVGTFSLRVREYSKNNTNKFELNTKVINQYNDHNSWEEHEVEVSSGDEMQIILNIIGFKQFFSIEKTRYTFAKENVTINIEDVKNFKPIIEVEIITDKESSTKAKEQIFEILNDLGVDKSQVVPRSITSLLMEQSVQF